MNTRFNNRIVGKAVDVKNIRTENDIVKNAFFDIVITDLRFNVQRYLQCKWNILCLIDI